MNTYLKRMLTVISAVVLILAMSTSVCATGTSQRFYSMGYACDCSVTATVRSGSAGMSCYPNPGPALPDEGIATFVAVYGHFQDASMQDCYNYAWGKASCYASLSASDIVSNLAYVNASYSFMGNGIGSLSANA